jgi:hypothetical protein
MRVIARQILVVQPQQAPLQRFQLHVRFPPKILFVHAIPSASGKCSALAHAAYRSTRIL